MFSLASLKLTMTLSLKSAMFYLDEDQLLLIFT